MAIPKRGGSSMPPPGAGQLPGAGRKFRTPSGLATATASARQQESEETVAFDARRTPAVSMPAFLLESAVGEEPVLDDISGAGSAQGTARLVSEPSLPTISISSSDGDVELSPIDGSPEAGAPESPSQSPDASVIRLRIGTSSYPVSMRPSAPARPRPSRMRSVFAKALFSTVTVAVLLLVAAELSTARRIPWLDPRPHVLKAWRFAVAHIPQRLLPRAP